jgi:hypothetical protein
LPAAIRVRSDTHSTSSLPVLYFFLAAQNGCF